jgi:outer membrane protein TolC
MKALLIILSLSNVPGISSVPGYAAPAADTVRLTLQQVVDMAKHNSISAKQALTLRETKYWQWRSYKSNYQPQLSLTGDLPAYSKTFVEVVQPNGTILFQNIHNDNSSVQLNFSQSITATGGTVSGTTGMQRYDDLDGNAVSYNGVPYAIAYSQPLFQYNSLKWDNRIEPLKYQESKQAFLESQEQLSVTVEGYFFDLLLGQVNLKMAENNLANTESILKIANTKFELGKVSQNEILQLKLEQLNARKAVGIARRDMEIATLNLRS